MIIFSLLLTFIMSIIITPFVIKLAKKIGATDAPDERKVHDKIMPRLGGLGIYISFLIGVFIFIDDYKSIAPILIGSLIIVLTGFVDDLYTITPKVKLFGQLLAALVTVIGGVRITYVTIPIFDRVEFGLLAIPVTIIWIIAITNAINLIDGLDGLAAGISSIALITISILSIIMANPLVALLGTLLLGSTLGFLVFNFHPAKIFMGDTGS
ncbi:MAG: undecaprenyl/decaprenyl-phosphate alpha-N-acetylglucosaminyl 1-phosphate transferase, partial [Tissierellia bacterium]|nr:undecaprenyl/decaprenyl-phosphate alpha-N-acetylglucosaminyl 1-phosphate transferase [Tissierellia bacterium]